MSMMSRHAPQPWGVRRNATGTLSIVSESRYAQGAEIAAVTAHPWSEETAEKNANLLAGAPKLLAALKRMVEQHDGKGIPDDVWVPEFRAVLQEGRAAIAEAEGRTS